MSETTRRTNRNATIAATATAHGPFTITGALTFPRTTDGNPAEKATAWITGARGYNMVGLLTANGTPVHTGATTVADLISIGAVTNPEALATGGTAAPLPGAVALPSSKTEPTQTGKVEAVKTEATRPARKVTTSV